MRIIRYLFAGGCTTLVNFALYTLLTRAAGMDANISNIVAVVCSVLFAYAINKLFVFRSKAENPRALLREFISFAGARGMTIALDVAGLYIFHTLLGLYDIAVKAALVIIVVILNYVISRFFVFKT
ncbi:MAG: GtrA family protein [Oscillospiraceae bacterium]|nr:GtrA family protein [Oscillospiraceae bacterium]